MSSGRPASLHVEPRGSASCRRFSGGAGRGPPSARSAARSSSARVTHTALARGRVAAERQHADVADEAQRRVVRKGGSPQRARERGVCAVNDIAAPSPQIRLRRIVRISACSTEHAKTRTLLSSAGPLQGVEVSAALRPARAELLEVVGRSSRTARSGGAGWASWARRPSRADAPATFDSTPRRCNFRIGLAPSARA